MINRDYPVVAIIGGLWDVNGDTAASIKAAGKLIGGELAKAGFGLVVYFSNEESLEPHVVSGFMAALQGKERVAGKIIVRYADPQRGVVKFAEETNNAEIFEHRPFPGNDWEAPFYQSLAENEGVDAAVFLRGAKSTLIAGQITLARRIPILAIADFGGAAGVISNQLATSKGCNQNHPPLTQKNISTFVAQLKAECQTATTKQMQARVQEQNSDENRVKHKQVWAALIALVVLIIMVTTLWSWTIKLTIPVAYPYIIVGGLLGAGALGAMIRLIIWGDAKNDTSASLLLGAVAGFIVGLTTLLPQWIGNKGMLIPTESNVHAILIQFIFVVVVAISAGVTFDKVYDDLRKGRISSKLQQKVSKN
jgi:hypothetical protein